MRERPLPGETEAHRAARRAPVVCYRTRPDSVLVHRPERVQIVTPSDLSGSLNEVLWLELPRDDPEAAIDEVFASYEALGVPFKWCVWPWSQPHDLRERLRARGTSHWGARGMSIRPPPTTAWPSSVRAVQTAADRDDYARIYAEGWSEPLSAVRHDVEAQLASGDVRLFVALDGDAPAGVASTRQLSPNAAYLMGTVVLPAHRGRGLYRALIAARLADLVARGVAIGVTHAREATSAPILERVGFRTEFRYEVHRAG